MTFLINPKGIEFGVVLVSDNGQETFIFENGNGWENYLEWVELGNNAEPYPEPEEQELSEDQKIQQKLELMAIGKRVIAFIGIINDEKAEELSPQDYVTMVTDPNMGAAGTMLERGLLRTAKAFIANTAWPLYTEEEIDNVIAFMTSQGVE